MSTTTKERQDAISIIKGHRKSVLEKLRDKEAWSLTDDLWSFAREEYEQQLAFQSLVENYIKLATPPRPLCLAVFGPPGSGKSFLVKDICKHLKTDQHDKSQELKVAEVNLTELASTADLIRAIRAVRLDMDGRSVPVIFFDEFDAPLAGVPLGWLSRFLAPMQDGKLVDAGERFELKRAIYIFAGGTASRMEDFGRAAGARFREAKGPDFVSRLRGYVDVRGPNDPKGTMLRRALLIESALKRVRQARTGEVPQKGKEPPAQPISDELIEAMLDAGRFRHGSRSIEAIIEMAAAKASADEPLTREHLPPPHVLNVHRDLGELDPFSINGLIGLSAGDSESQAPPGVPQDAWKEVAVNVVERLWKIGAVVGYGGKWNDNPLMKELVERLANKKEVLVEAPSKLASSEENRPKVRLEVFAREQPDALVPKVIGLSEVPVPAYWSSLPQGSFLARAATTFRMRWMMSCRCVARVFIAGKLSGYSGRMPGILEETMLALALNQPLYVIGGFGGSAQVVGELLGLSKAWPPDGRSVGSFGRKVVEDANKDRTVTQASGLFRPAGVPDLPLTFTEAMTFVTGYSIGGPKWPPNGLSLDENRELFFTPDQDRIVELVLNGLTRRFQG
ncbi:MAG: AAA family ATPase [Hyalangium sp.]|uniref:AAA family ATPase n=1 Tax=Hyalangium sp. TaxID=2028555 RepID=UPI00389AEB5C